jgi:hypothetical protein
VATPHGIYGFENIGGDGCVVRLVAITDPSGEYRLEPGNWHR